jgi:iron complex outermembrane receptor protein
MARPDFSALGARSRLTTPRTPATAATGPEADPLDQRRRDARVVFRAAIAVVGRPVLPGPVELWGFGNHEVSLLNIKTGTFDTYLISSPTNSSGRVKGVELAYQQLPLGFGIQANYTYADARKRATAIW